MRLVMAHIASFTAGNLVLGANLLGNANGTTAMIAQLAHLAMYKIKTSTYSKIDIEELNVLGAIRTAVNDEVDVISLSIDSLTGNFLVDNIAMGVFQAIEKGIFVCVAAGNDGPDFCTVRNYTLQILNIGASTIDRKIRVTVVMGNN